MPGARRLSRGPNELCVSAPDDLQNLTGPALPDAGIRGLDIEPEQRFRVGGPDVEPPVRVLDREPVGAVLRAAGERSGQLLQLPRRVGDLRVDLARVPVAAERL